MNLVPDLVDDAKSIILGLHAQFEREKRVRRAAASYIARRDRKEHPDGTFDTAKRWYPSDKERQDCCDAIRSPTRNWPYSYVLHCRTLPHVAKLFDVTPEEIRAYLRS